MLITFEGIDGCGKSTQIRMITNWLERKKIPFRLFREPGGTDLSERIRELLLDRDLQMDPVTELLLFSAARSQLIREEVIPLLDQNQLVLLDRFYDSTTAYQGYGRGAVPPGVIEELNRLAAHNLVPNLTIYLKITPELARNRRGEQGDRMERAGDDFFKKVAGGFDELAAQSSRFVTLDASLGVDEIHGHVVRAVEAVL